MVIMRRFDAESVLKAVSTYSITGMVMVSTMVHIMRDLPNRLSYDTSSLTWLVFGQVAENMLEDIRAIFPNASLKNSYGLTESCSTATTIDDVHQKLFPTSPGRVVACFDLRIVDEDGNEVPRGHLGEIVLKGPKTMLGYWRNPTATAEALRDGWLHTGDVGYLDANDLLYVIDRKKDMIRTGGENVASQEIERVIYELEWVAEVAVVGIADEKWGERIRAVIVPRDGFTPSQVELIEHCKGKLASFKVPKEVLFRSELPRNPSGKVLKRDLR
jgi:acyl-CoA synthetase (AMP-forming)/AMP-acid ligase II